MIINIDKFDYDFIKDEDSFFITYRNEEFCTLIEKINIVPFFSNIVKRNNGEIIGFRDYFENEEDVQNAMIEIKEYLSNECTQIEIFKAFLDNYLEVYGEIDCKQLENYLFMLEKESILKILEIN